MREITEEIRQEISRYTSGGGRAPKLAVILVGNNPASLSYIKGKKKAAEQVGIDLEVTHLSENASQDELEAHIRICNEDPDTDGILIQLPLPKGLDDDRAVALVDPVKDVDGLHPVNVGRLHLGMPGHVPCTPQGIMKILERMGCDPDGKTAVVVGRSRLVGAPVARLLQNANATVTVCHTRTVNVPEICKKADIIISAAGVLNSLTAEYVREGQIVIDVSMNWNPEKITSKGKGGMSGDCVFDEVEPIVEAITPVPGGVGAVTTTVLMKHVVEAAEKI